MSGEDGEGERHAVAEGVGAAPDRAERAQPGGVPELQRLEIGVDRLGALEVQDRDRGRAALDARVEVGDRAGDHDLALRARARSRRPPPRSRARLPASWPTGSASGSDRPVGAEGCGAPVLPGRRREDGEDPAAHPALAHPRQVEVAALAPAREVLVVLSRQCVVVTVEDGNHEVDWRLGV